MRKQDLKTGMAVILDDGSVGKVLLNTSDGDVIVFSDSSWINLDDLDNNMTAIGGYLEKYDIIKVYKPLRVTKCLEFDLKYYNLAWQRKGKEYYLKDNFIAQDGNNGYLNFIIINKTFCIADVDETSHYKTKFTDKEIEELEIPIERFEKIEVEEEL